MHKLKIIFIYFSLAVFTFQDCISFMSVKYLKMASDSNLLIFHFSKKGGKDQETIQSSTVTQWLSGRVLDSRPKGHGFEPHWRHCVVVLEQDTFILAWYWFNPGTPVPV